MDEHVRVSGEYLEGRAIDNFWPLYSSFWRSPREGAHLMFLPQGPCLCSQYPADIWEYGPKPCPSSFRMLAKPEVPRALETGMGCPAPSGGASQ